MLIIIVAGTLFLLILSLMAINRYAADSKNLTLIKIGAATFILNIGILLFLIISFKNIQSTPGPEGPRGKDGPRGKRGPKDNCNVCSKPINSFSYINLNHIEKERRLGNMIRDIRK